MSTIAQRLAIGQSIVEVLSAIENPNTNLPLYQLVKLGHVLNPGNAAAWCEVTILQGMSGPAGSGGNLVGWRIEDNPTFLVTSAAGPYEVDSEAAETAILTIMDVTLPVLRQHYQMPQANNIVQAIPQVYSVLLNQADRTVIKVFPNGHTYKLWNVLMTVKQQYNITLVSP